MCIQIRRSPEKEEPPYAVSHELTEDKGPCLFVAETLPELHSLFIFFVCHWSTACFAIILLDVVKLCLIDMFAFRRGIIHKHPESHPDKAKSTNYDKCHFPTEHFCQDRNGKRSDQCSDRCTSIKDRSSISTVFFREVLCGYFNSGREVTGFS